MLARHSLVWLNAGGWQRAAQAVAPGYRAGVEQWQRADWPAVLRRQEPDIRADQVCLGLPLPPDASGYKIRIPFKAESGAIQRIEPPLALNAVLAHAPSWWIGALHAFAKDCRRIGIAMRIYGSWSWQILTQQAYVGPASDIDLLFIPKSATEFSRGMALLEQYAAHLPLDGEIVFPDGQAVAWKECRQVLHADSRQRVLVKTETTVRLMTLSTLIMRLEDCVST
jgi:phosphoribosyl-dephospho-CoA transferase